MKVKANIADVEHTISILWRHHTENVPPTAPASYDTPDGEEDVWYKHPILPRGRYVFLSICIDDQPFGDPVLTGIATDPL